MFIIIYDFLMAVLMALFGIYFYKSKGVVFESWKLEKLLDSGILMKDKKRAESF